jgi:hypothetical protein
VEARINVEGLSEFQRALKRLDAEAPKALRLALNGVADFVIGEARTDIPRRTGRAAASLKAKSTRTAVRISVGGRKAAYYPFLDFGGRVGRNKSVVRPYIAGGRYLFPALTANRDKAIGLLRQALHDVAADAGLDVT